MKCKSDNYIGIGKGEFDQQSAQDLTTSTRAQRDARVRAAAKAANHLQSAIKACRRPGEGFGDATARFELIARRYNRPIAARLTEILQICGCSREIAIANLNAQHQDS